MQTSTRSSILPLQCLQQFTAEEVLEAGTKYCKACTNAAGEGAEPQEIPLTDESRPGCL